MTRYSPLEPTHGWGLAYLILNEEPEYCSGIAKLSLSAQP